MSGNVQGMGVTTVQTDDLAILVAGWIAQRWFKSQIKNKLEELLGDRPSPRAVETLLARARELIQEGTVATVEEHRAASIAFYTDVIRNPKCEVRYKIKCQERLDVLLQLEAPADDGSGFADKQAKIREMLYSMQEDNDGDTEPEQE